MARSPKEAVSVYDFLYVDQRRIGILLSQFGTEGILAEIIRLADVGTETGVGFDIKVAKADTRNAAKNTLSRRFDPQWLLPLMFLKEAKDIITRDLSKATIGQIVIVKGSLEILDLSTLKVAWSSPNFKKMFLDGNVPAIPANSPSIVRKAHEVERKNNESTVSMTIDIVGSMPHTVQATVSSGSDLVWAILREDSMTIASSDVALKYGTSLAGNWALIGILDAKPEEPALDGAHEPTPSNNSLIANMARLLAPITRQAMGRAMSTYGVTPLLISREVSAD